METNLFAFSWVHPGSPLHLQLHQQQSPIFLHSKPSPVYTDTVFKEPRTLLEDHNAKRGGLAGEQWEHPTSLSLSFFIFTNMSTGSAHFQGQAFLTDHRGREGWERGKWQKISTSNPVGKWIDIWIHKGQENIGWRSLAFNSLSAFLGEDNIIWSHFDVLYPIAYMKVFQHLLLFYQLLHSIPLPGDQQISLYSAAGKKVYADRSPTPPANPGDYLYRGLSSTSQVVTAKLN